MLDLFAHTFPKPTLTALTNNCKWTKAAEKGYTDQFRRIFGQKAESLVSEGKKKKESAADGDSYG